MVTPQWPPSPCVEDEDAALAREHDFNQPVEPPNSDNQPAGCRGAVDQTPIILDADANAIDSNQPAPIRKGRRPSDSQSSDDSLGPATPSATHSEQRFVYIPHATAVPPPKAASKPATSTHDHGAEKPRGRPEVAPIQTNLGSDLEGMVTGRRRAPSPYSYHREAPSAGSKPPAASFLSPVVTMAPQKAPSTEARRAASAMPRIRSQDSDSSTDSDRRPERRRHHSRIRSKRESFSRSNRPVIGDFPPSAKVDKQAPSLAQPRTDQSLLSKGLQDTLTGHSSRGSKLSSRESPYASAAEESRKSKSSRPSPRDGLGSTKESPYTSSAEEARSRHRHHHRRRDSGTSSRNSVHLKEQPRIDTSSHYYSYGAGHLPEDKYDLKTHRHNPKHHAVFDGRSYLEPASAKSPEAMEDAFDKAFRANQAKVAGGTPRGSPMMSPYTSPPRTPPRTPRGERKSKDYFDLTSPLSTQQQARSRPRSVEESQFSGLKPLTAAIAAASIGTASPKFVPTYTRSSTASLDTSSSGSMSKSTSGQRSRKPSPVYEEPRPMSRSGSYASRDIQPLARPSTFPVNSERPSSRSGSYIAPPLEPPRLVQRASSYTHANESSGSRPSSSYRISQPNAVPAPASDATLAPAALPKLVRSSPSSSSNIKSMTSQTPLQNVLPPPCPRSLPSTGHADWYTVKGIPEMDICPSCMGVLGNSHFRDHFLPSLAKPRNQPIHCSLSEPWYRLAWTQIHKQQKPTLEMMWHLAHRPPTTKPCPGQLPEVRSWYRIIDPTTLKPVPNFEACSDCVRSVDVVFPQLKGIFERTGPSLLQEKSCNLNVKSKRFDGYMTQLDKAATKFDYKKWRFSDCIQAFVFHASRISLVPECTRDNVMASQPWHFMPQLPDFTICEECYAEVVWPVRGEVIARDVGKLLQLVPSKAGTPPNAPGNLHSCQLYSDRMRQVFRESVQFDDFEYLESQAKKRREIERLCQEKHKLLARDVAAGLNRTEEMAKNLQLWKSW